MSAIDRPAQRVLRDAVQSAIHFFAEPFRHGRASCGVPAACGKILATSQPVENDCMIAHDVGSHFAFQFRPRNSFRTARFEIRQPLLQFGGPGFVERFVAGTKTFQQTFHELNSVGFGKL